MIKSKKIKVLIISILCILAITIGLSYGYYLLNKVQENNNIAGSKCFNLEFTNEKNAISLDNMYPISDEEGRKLTPYSFTITNTCDMLAGYTVNMEMLEGTTLNSKYLDVMVNNEQIKLLTNYESTNTVITGSTESRILAKGTLAYNDSVDYTVRFWMDKDVEDTESMNKLFKSKIVISATPSSWNPKDAGYDTLHDAILANEYQTTPEDAVSKIEAKGTPDFSQTAPIISWKEKINESIQVEDTNLPTQDNSDIMSSSVYYPYISTEYTFDKDSGEYKLVNAKSIDPTTLDYSNTSYYFCDGGYNINSSNKLTSFSHTTCSILKKIVSVNPKKYLLSNKFNMINYQVNAIFYGTVEEETDKSDKGLYKSDDDYGTTYYYRGNVQNNNIYFAGFYWKIIRINGDNSIRLIYNDDANENYISSIFNLGTSPAYTGYMYGTENGDISTIENILSNKISSKVKETVDGFYESYILNKYDNYLSDTGFCGDRSLYQGDGLSNNTFTHYRAYSRLNVNKTPLFKCPNILTDLYTTNNSTLGNKALTYPVALITADEVAAAGIVFGQINTLNYLVHKKTYFTMTPWGFDSGGNAPLVMKVLYNGKFYQWSFGDAYNVNPVINLKSDVKITGGIGTSNDPYVIDTSK